MLDKLMKHTKRSTAVLLTMVILMTTAVVAYALVSYITTETQRSAFDKKEYFEMECSEIFSESSVVGPGETVSINPVITSNASMDMYVFIRVEMPMYNGGGLYELSLNSEWSLLEREINGDKCIEVYHYNTALTPGSSTTPLANSLTMVNIGMADYAVISDINVSMTGYACKTDVDIEDAWNSIKSERSM